MMVLLAVAGVSLMMPGQVVGQGKTSDSVIKAKAALKEKNDKDGTQKVEITLEIDSKFHIYANPVGNEDFESNKTTVTLVSKGELVKVEYPKGEVVKDTVVGEYKVLKGKVVFNAIVKSATPKDPIEFGVKVQACNDKTCYLPATVKVKLP
jgi:hypothetical protein